MHWATLRCQSLLPTVEGCCLCFFPGCLRMSVVNVTKGLSVTSKRIKAFAAVVRPWLRQCSRVGFESIFSGLGLGLDYITGISITPSDPLCFWRGALRSGRGEGKRSNVHQQRYPQFRHCVPTKSGQAPTNNARILHVSSCHVFVSPALPATGALSGVNNSTPA